MSDPTQATSTPPSSGVPAGAAPTAPAMPSAIPTPVPPRGSALPHGQPVIPAGAQAAPAGATPAESEAPSALIPGSGDTGGTGGTPPPQNWRDTLPAELKNEKALGAVSSVEDLAKSYVHAQKLLGGPKISIPDPKLATPEDYRNVFKKLGLPEDAKDYKVEVPKEAGLDDEFVKQFKENAFKAGILPNHAQSLIDWYTDASKGMVKTLQESQTKQIQEEHANLHKEWGQAYDQKILATQLVVKDFADEETLSFLKETGLHQNPKFLKFLARIGETIKEPQLKGGGGRGTLAKTPAEATQEANAIIADQSHPYNNAQHPNHKAAVEMVNSLFAAAHPEAPKES